MDLGVKRATECNYLVVLINSQARWGIAEVWSITSVTYDLKTQLKPVQVTRTCHEQGEDFKLTATATCELSWSLEYGWPTP